MVCKGRVSIEIQYRYSQFFELTFESKIPSFFSVGKNVYYTKETFEIQRVFYPPKYTTMLTQSYQLQHLKTFETPSKTADRKIPINSDTTAKRPRKLNTQHKTDATKCTA